MKNKIPDAAQVWKDLEDLLAPRLSLTSSDRVVYSHLFRHSRLEGKLQFSFVTPWLARGTGLCCQTARDSLRRLNSQGVLDIIERSHQGYVVRLRLPQEVRAVHTPRTLPAVRRACPASLATSKTRISGKRRPCGVPSTIAKAASAFIVCAVSTNERAAWITLSHA